MNMTEQQWLTSTNSQNMLRWLNPNNARIAKIGDPDTRHLWTKRKLHLFDCSYYGLFPTSKNNLFDRSFIQANLVRCVFGNPFQILTLCGLKRKVFDKQYAHVNENNSFWLESECPLCAKIRNNINVSKLAKAAYIHNQKIPCPEKYGKGQHKSPDFVSNKWVCETCQGSETIKTNLLENDRLYVLADLLDELDIATELTTHLRNSNWHCRGCWVLDLLLNKS